MKAMSAPRRRLSPAGQPHASLAGPADRPPEVEVLLPRIAVLGRRRARLLASPALDLAALAALLAEYEAAGLPGAAADLRRRLEHYRGKWGRGKCASA